MIKYSSDGIPYTLSKEVAEKFKIRDNKQIHFIKNPRYKEYLRIHGSWKKFYKYMKPYYILPPSQGWIKGNERVYKGLYSDSLYDRQKEAVEYVVGMYNKKQKSCFIISGTGTGKGHIVPSILNSFDDRKIVLIAPNDVVASRLMDDLDGIAKYVRGKKILKALDERVLVTLYKTFNLYIDEINSNYEIVLIDEGHHVGGQLENSLYTWKGFICGMSATPYRSEYNESGFDMFFGNMLDTQKQALPVEVYQHKFKYEYKAEAVVKAQEGLAPTSPELYRRLIMDNDTRYDELGLIISNIKERKGLRNYIIFSDRLDHIAKIKKYLEENIEGFDIMVVKGESDQMKIMEEMKGKQDIIIIGSTAVVKEGMNIPQLEVGILFTSASYRGGLDQMAGRVRRYYGKKKCGYFIDFQDYISIAGSKYKSPGVYSRRKAYKQFGWKIGDLVTDFIQ